MSGGAIRICLGVHKWTSLVCTLFLLLLCLTGLPLIFKDEIGIWSGTTVLPEEMPQGTPRASVDRFVEEAGRRRPDDRIRYVSQSDDQPAWYVSMGRTADAAEPTASFKYDARTARMINDIPQRKGVMYVIRVLHIELFAGLPGTLFVGAMGLCFVVSMVSGVMLYAPFTRRLGFGTVRGDRSRRVRWLDLHNLLGIVATAWLLVVGVTGIINTLTLPLLSLWQRTEVTDMTAAWRGQPPLVAFSSAQAAIDTARSAAPGMDVSFIGFPGSRFATPHHYMVFMRGDSPITSRLLKPVMIDAESGALVDSRTLPWYLTMILLSQPLHFGDYGGLPLKVIWALLDLVAIVLLVSGLYLWAMRRRAPLDSGIDELEAAAP
ncbi:MAG: Peptidase [Reyranella sp.]|nr:Peptidase [Reyranella sp.]